MMHEVMAVNIQVCTGCQIKDKLQTRLTARGKIPTLLPINVQVSYMGI